MIYFFVFLFALAFGSFFNVCIVRLPQKQSLIPPSHCPKCNYKITKLQNIPIFSYLFLRGKCKNCGSKIPLHYFLVEFITPVVFILLYLKFGLTLDFAKFIIFFSFGIIIFFIDYFHQLIPDKLSLPLILLGFIFAFIAKEYTLILGAIFGFGFFYILGYLFKYFTKKDGIGGGDIKLITAIGAFFGLSGVIFTIIVSAIIALIFLLSIGYDKRKYFPFGPFLIFTSFLHTIVGSTILSLYWNLFL